MKQVYEYDNEGYFVGRELIEGDEIPINCTKVKPPDGMFKAKFVENTWVETKPQEEIDAILNAPKPKTQFEILQETVDQLVLDNLTRGF